MLSDWQFQNDLSWLFHNSWLYFYAASTNIASQHY